LASRAEAERLGREGGGEVAEDLPGTWRRGEKAALAGEDLLDLRRGGHDENDDVAGRAEFGRRHIGDAGGKALAAEGFGIDVIGGDEEARLVEIAGDAAAHLAEADDADGGLLRGFRHFPSLLFFAFAWRRF
jgi:hypothetical protein